MDDELPLPWNGGTMTTAGNLVFFGDINGCSTRSTPRPASAVADECRQRRRRRANELRGGRQAVCRDPGGRAESPPAFMGETGKKIIAATPEGGTCSSSRCK